jgi:hypothetical protein
MDREALIAKIKKLLALGRRSPYPAEAEAALAAAQRMMLEHGLNESCVDAPGHVDGYDTVTLHTGRMPVEGHYVGVLIVRWFFCRIVLGEDWNGNRTIVAFGRAEHLPFAEHLWTYLTRTFRALWTVYRREHGCPQSERKLYYHGLALGIGRRLERERSDVAQSAGNGQGLALRDVLARWESDLDRSFLARFGDLPGRRQDTRYLDGDRATLRAGIERGEKIALNRPLPQAQSAATRRLLLEDQS